MHNKSHWEQIYGATKVEQLSWYQRHANLSLALIEKIAPNNKASIIDVGGGASVLVDDLLAADYRNLTVLDLSEHAFDTVKQRLGDDAKAVDWWVADVLEVALPEQAFDVWHDRAVFHFLTTNEDRQRYISQVRKSLLPDGHVVIATFAENGPPRCSGLEVQRYSLQTLSAVLGPEFKLLDSRSELHITPDGRSQPFIYGAFKRSS